jgi:hypothetical protein
MRSGKVVYIAGAYQYPDPVINTRIAIDAWETLFQAGWIPIVPHISLFVHLVHPHPVEDWYAYDLALLERCDILLRIPSESPGAEVECQRAKELGMPVHRMTAAEFVACFGRADD